MIIGYDAKRAFHNPTGLGNYSRTLLTAMFKQHPENQYVLFDTKNPMDLPYFQRALRESGAQWKYEGSSGSFGRMLSWGKKAAGLKLDVYHGLSNEIPLDWNSRRGTKAVVTIHDVIFRRFPEAYKWTDRFIYQQKTAFACKKADLILVPSKQTRADLEGWFPACKGRVEVLYQDTSPAFHYRKRPEAVAKVLYKYDLVERPYILCVSRLEKRKNHLRLLEAFKKVMPQMQEDLVLVGGRGDTADEVLDQVGDFNGRLRWLGAVDSDDLVNLYDGCVFTVFPSVFEGFGIPVLESIRRGKAVLTSKDSCFEEVAGDAGGYVDSMSADDIAEGMLAISEDAGLRFQLEEAARRQASRFDLKTLTEELHSHYKRLL
jgi:glycosyltransferase involved in cell wall biosynthesis